MVHSVVPSATCQKEAREFAGGVVKTCAGRVGFTEVSDTSMDGLDPNPAQLTEQVADEPCDAGGVHIWMESTLTEPKKDRTVELVAVHIAPAANMIVDGVIGVAVPEVDTNRNRWLSRTFD